MCDGAARPLDPARRSRPRPRLRECHKLSGAGPAPSLPRRRQRDRDPAGLWQRPLRQQGRAARRQPLPDDRRGTEQLPGSAGSLYGRERSRSRSSRSEREGADISTRPDRLWSATAVRQWRWGLGSGRGIVIAANLHGSRGRGFWDRNIRHKTGGHAVIEPSTAGGARPRPRREGAATIDAARVMRRPGRRG